MPKIRDSFIAILSGIAAEETEADITELRSNEFIAKGPDIAKNVVKVIEETNISSSESLPSQVIGLEDISSRGITKELLSVKKHLEVILERMSEGILEITYDGKIVFANLSALTLINTVDDKLLGTNFLDLFTGGDRNLIAKALHSIDSGPASLSYDSTVSLNGYELTLDIYPIDENNKTAIVIFNNVTERKQWERSLHESKELLNTFINSTNEAMISIAQDGLITIFNTPAEKMFGRKKEQTIGQPFDCLVPESHKKQVEAYFYDDWPHNRDFDTA